MSFAEELPPLVSDDTTMETLLPPKNSTKTGEEIESALKASVQNGNAEDTEEKKTPSPSGKTAQEEEGATLEAGEETILQDGNIGNDVIPEIEEVDGGNYPKESDKSAEGKTPKVSKISSEAEGPFEEAKKSQKPSAQADEGKKTLKSMGEEEPFEEAKKSHKPSAQGDEGKKTLKSMGEDIPPKHQPSRVSFNDKPMKKSQDQPKRGFMSNRDVRLPALADGDPAQGATTMRDRMTSMSGAFDSQMQPWLYAVFGLFVLTVLMRFFMSNTKFLLIVLYAGVVSLLALGYYGQGPLARRGAARRLRR